MAGVTTHTPVITDGARRYRYRNGVRTVTGPGVGHRAATLSWLCPAAGSLLALADDNPAPDAVFLDPALVVHVLRFGRQTRAEWTPQSLADPAVLAALSARLEPGSAGRCPWQDDTDPRLFALARIAGAVAARLYPADPSSATLAAQLAPLGWYAVAAVDPAAATPDRVRSWGLPPDAIARRLMRAWDLPEALATVAGNLHHAIPHAESLGADAGLFRAVQAAVAVTERELLDLRLAPNPDREWLEKAAATLNEIEIPTHPPTVDGIPWDADPRTVPLLAALIRAKAESRNQAAVAQRTRVEAENDTLHLQLARVHDTFQAAVQEAKLTAMAELAAGAGHEINNPLAVISGHCQRLLSHEEDEEDRATLETVVRQTKRIHDILRGMMHFARPSKPNPRPIRLAELLAAALADVRDLAAVKAVEIRDESRDIGPVRGDLHQLRTGTVNLLRNAIEAAGADGWVRVACEPAGDRVRIVIEDSGPGPNPKQAAHLFDPFYSGRNAGRGRGLGLSVAWRLAQVNGGSLAHDPTPDSPARFVLTLPKAVDHPVRASA